VARKRADDGFTLVEVVVALGIISVVMTSLTVFMVNSRRSGHYSSQRDTAVQLAVEGMEKARGVRGSALLGGRQACDGSCPAVISPTVTDLLGSGISRIDRTSAGTLTVPAPGAQADGSTVSAPTDPEVIQLDGTSFRRPAGPAGRRGRLDRPRMPHAVRLRRGRAVQRRRHRPVPGRLTHAR
jgi:prepilin-type N-terminal cleavage/methylation domain-containing protein